MERGIWECSSGEVLSVFRCVQPLANFWKRLAGSDLANLNEIGAVFEVVVAVASDVGFNDQVGILARLRAVHFLRDREALADHVENMPRTVAVGPAPFQV